MGREREWKSVEIRKRKRGERGGGGGCVIERRKRRGEKREKTEEKEKDVYRLLQSPSKSTYM